MFEYMRLRSALPHTKAALARGEITIGFIGGSITEPEDGKRWSDKIVDWFVTTYPELIVNEENAAKGATGTLSHVFRMEEDILKQNCDIVFVESVVNDPPLAFGACREGVLRKLLTRGNCDIVIVYTYCQGMYEDMLHWRLPEGVADYEEMAEHYHISSAHCGQYAFDFVDKGGMRWEEWLPDTLHPNFAGSRVYAELVAKLIEAGLETNLPSITVIPAPLHADCWEHTTMLPLKQIERHGAWRLFRERHLPTVDYILYTTSMRSSLKFTFEGRGLFVRTLVTKYAAGFRWRIDGEEWHVNNDRFPVWLGEAKDWITEQLLTSALENNQHTVEIEPMFTPDSHGSNFMLCTVGIIQK